MKEARRLEGSQFRSLLWLDEIPALTNEGRRSRNAPPLAV